MVKARVVETDHGIQGEFNVNSYDQMQKKLRDRGWMEINDILESGITRGCALEIGPGPGYLGLEWLKNTEGTNLKGLDISPDMIALAQRNAEEYGFTARTEYVCNSGNELPFDDNRFDAVFTNGSLHEWEDPTGTFDEMWRVTKPGGKVFISDLRRDMIFPIRWLLWISTQPKEIRPGLTTSINAAYTPDELRELIKGTLLEKAKISSNLIGVTLVCNK